jgi:hypothetical protein
MRESEALLPLGTLNALAESKCLSNYAAVDLLNHSVAIDTECSPKMLPHHPRSQAGPSHSWPLRMITRRVMSENFQ